MADSAMVSAYFFAQKIEDFHPRFLDETFLQSLWVLEFNIRLFVVFVQSGG